jgi:hypothetical protein
MMNYREMKDWELLAERSHMEQLGFNGEIQILEIDEELTRRRSEKAQEAATVAKESIKAKVFNEGKHQKGKRYVTNYGHYGYKYEDTELNEVSITLYDRYPGANATIVYNAEQEIQKITAFGPMSRTFNEAIKSTAGKWFKENYKGN